MILLEDKDREIDAFHLSLEIDFKKLTFNKVYGEHTTKKDLSLTCIFCLI
jgi:hypothetical protein